MGCCYGDTAGLLFWSLQENKSGVTHAHCECPAMAESSCSISLQQKEMLPAADEARLYTLSIWSKATALDCPISASTCTTSSTAQKRRDYRAPIEHAGRFRNLCMCTFVIAAVRVVFPWSTWPIVPTFKCGFVRVLMS